MDRTVEQIDEVDVAGPVVPDKQDRELGDLQLAFMGGGCADPILF